MNIKIRPGRPGGEAEIHESHMRSIREVCVIDHGVDEIRGFGYLYFFSEALQTHVYLHALYLTPELIGKGFGGKLVEIMLSQARAKGAQSIRLESSITAHNFYQNLGFKDRGPKQKFEIAGYPVTCFPMILTL